MNKNALKRNKNVRPIVCQCNCHALEHAQNLNKPKIDNGNKDLIGACSTLSLTNNNSPEKLSSKRQQKYDSPERLTLKLKELIEKSDHVAQGN